ncbi:MAG: outer membrane lipoprotein-sorting protein, partial [candidate division Zixibacteria bacterium]|nr:outer membrane lipoprotein-sorting protein [candidate division Zixibacteria bacterium]
LLVALLTLLSALGLMGHLGIPVTLVTTILPIILMAISITDSIHILERVQDELSAVKDKNTVAQVSSVSMKEVSANAIKQIAWPIVATSVTTALALLSFLSAGMAPMRHFGIFTSIGILIAMILSLTLVPALISIMPVKFFSRFGKSGKIRKSSSTALIARNPLVSFWGGVVFLALVAPGLLYLTVQDSWIDNFSANSRLAKAERIYNTNFWGSYRFDITVTEESGDFLTPSGVSTMKTLIRITSDAPFARGVVTFLTPLEAIKTSMGHKGSIESYSEELLAELTTVADLSQDRSGLTQLLTQDAAIARARIFVNTPNYQRGDSLRKFLAVKLSEDANLALNKFHFSGDIPVAVEIVESIVTNQMRSIGWTVLGVLVILFLVFRSVRLSLIGIIPSVLAMVIVFGLMGYFGMAVGIATSAFASLTIGVGVDFALHFIYRYRNEAEKLKGANTMSMSQETKKIALRETARKTGVAIRWNAIVLSLGFLSLSLSEIGPNRVLGILLAGAMVACYLATFAFLPRLLTRFLAIVIVCGLVSTAPVNAQDSLVQFENANFKNDRRAEKIFAKIEKRFRTTPRAIKMDIKTTYPNNRFLNRIMWGVTNNSEKRSWLLYVVTEPKRLGGTALLLNDNDADGPPDSSWLYLPGFKHFRHISGRAHKTLVPGTTLSYEDSRGYISTEKYFFRFQEIPNSRKDTAYIIAWPKTDSISQDLGYSKLEIAVDRRKFLVARVRFIGLRGQTVKFYRVLNTTKLAGMWLPSEVTLKIHASEMVTLARYSYWKLSHEPAESIFTPSIDSVKFLPRLLDVLERNGIDIEN